MGGSRIFALSSGRGGGGGRRRPFARRRVASPRRGSSRETRLAGLITDRARSFIFASAALAIHGHTDDRIYTSSTCTRIQHGASQFMDPGRVRTSFVSAESVSFTAFQKKNIQ